MPPWAQVGLIAFGVLLWLTFVTYSIAVISGWRRLATRYRVVEPFHGQLRRFRSGRLNYSMGYHNCLTLGTNAHGLYISALFSLLPGHPPLFVPWTDVTANVVRRWFGSSMEFRFAQAPGVVLHLPAVFGQEIAADANQAWARAGRGSPGGGMT